MKQLISLCLCASVLNLSAAVPLRWTVETSRAVPATFEAYQGETLNFEAALTSYGKPLEAPSSYSFFWQTNGMGSSYWEAPANGEAASSPLVGTNVLFATWSPTNDVGARVYNCFIGQPGTIYHAAFQLRLRPSPGATPNELPLPQKVIDFSKVTVLNPPWSGGGGGGGVDTNAVIDIVRDTLATNGIRAVDGAARPLPKYLHTYNADDSYPDAAAEYYRQRGSGVPAASCSSVRSGGFLYRNFDYPFDDRAEFVVKMSSSTKRFASVGVAQVGTNLTEQIVTSGKPSRCYKWLPGATVDGINENGVACNINVVDGEPHWEGGASHALHPLAAVRWILDHATNAQHAAEYIASHIRFPVGWTQNFHYMIADGEKTYIVEDGEAFEVTWDMPPAPILTNFPLVGEESFRGAGVERWNILREHASITNVWYTNAYRRETNPPWMSDLEGLDTNIIFSAWAAKPKESHRGETFGYQTWWQTVHTSVYDLTNRVLRVAVQETDDWYVFQVPSSGGSKVDAYTKSETDAKLAGKASVSGGFIDDRVMFIGKDQSQGGAPIINTRERILDGGDWFVNGDVECEGGHSLKSKANRPDGWDSSHAGNLAALDWNGDLTDSPVGTDERGIKIEAYGGTTSVQLNDGGVYIVSYQPGAGDVTVVDNSSYPSVRHDLSAKADRSMISAMNATFAAEVMKVQVASLSTNITEEVYIAATNACANLGIDPALIPGAGTTGTVGGIIVMLFAVVFWMRKKIFDNSGKVNDDFATDLLGKQVSISAMHYALGTAITASTKLADRTTNFVNALSTLTDHIDLTFPDLVTGKCRDFLVRVHRATGGVAVSFTAPTNAVIYGDGFSTAIGENEDWLFAITETAANEWYVRAIKLEVAA